MRKANIEGFLFFPPNAGSRFLPDPNMGLIVVILLITLSATYTMRVFKIIKDHYRAYHQLL